MARNTLDDDRVIIERHNGGSSMSALLAGIAIGAGLALLFAPHSGEETRQLIRRKARRARRLAGDYAGDVRERAYVIRDRASDLVSETRERGREMIDDARERIEDRVDETRRSLREKKSELRRAVDEGRSVAREARKEFERRLADTSRPERDDPTTAGPDANGG